MADRTAVGPSGSRRPWTPTTWQTARNDLRIGLADGGVTVRETDLALSSTTYATGLASYVVATDL